MICVTTESGSGNMACKIKFKNALTAWYCLSDQNSNATKEELRHTQLDNVDGQTVKTVCYHHSSGCQEVFSRKLQSPIRKKKVVVYTSLSKYQAMSEKNREKLKRTNQNLQMMHGTLRCAKKRREISPEKKKKKQGQISFGC